MRTNQEFVYIVAWCGNKERQLNYYFSFITLGITCGLLCPCSVTTLEAGCGAKPPGIPLLPSCVIVYSVASSSLRSLRAMPSQGGRTHTLEADALTRGDEPAPGGTVFQHISKFAPEIVIKIPLPLSFVRLFPKLLQTKCCVCSIDGLKTINMFCSGFPLFF